MSNTFVRTSLHRTNSGSEQLPRSLRVPESLTNGPCFQVAKPPPQPTFEDVMAQISMMEQNERERADSSLAHLERNLSKLNERLDRLEKIGDKCLAVSDGVDQCVQDYCLTLERNIDRMRTVVESCAANEAALDALETTVVKCFDSLEERLKELEIIH